MPQALDQEQWRSVFDLYQRAAELPAPKWRSFLESSNGSPEIIREVFALLGELDSPSSRSGVRRIPWDDEARFQEIQEEFGPETRVSRVGARIGRFLITGELGRGGMGEVYSALDTELERTVALKFLAPEVIGVRAAVERFIREAKTASTLNHANIVTVHEVIQSESTVAIVMELVEGTSLRTLCGKPLPLGQVVEIGRQIAQALTAAHAAGIVHRDIKPENVMVRGDGCAKVLDFGLARWVGPTKGFSNWTTGPGLPPGTWRYMSPEQAKAEPVTGATDVFSLGLMLYEAATGKHPFAAGSAFETLQATVSQEPERPSALNASMPMPLDRLLLAMLAKSSSARPSAEQIAEALSDLKQIPEIPWAMLAAKRFMTAARGKWTWATLIVLLAGGLAALYWTTHSLVEHMPAFDQVTTLVPENRATAAAISPDGQLTAYANVDGIFIRALQTGETKALPAPADFVVDRLAWFTDGTKLVASGFSTLTNIPSVWRISAGSTPPRLLRTMARQGSPSPDGTRIAFTERDRSAISVMGASGEGPRQVLSGSSGDTFPLVIWSANGRRLAFQRQRYSARRDRPNRSLARYYEQSYESLALDTGRVVARVPELWVDSAVALPDGRLLFLKWDSPGSDFPFQLWWVKTDVTTGAFLGVPHKITSSVDQNESKIYDMSATRDGQRVMVLRQSDQKAVFVGEFGTSPPRIINIHRLTLDERTSYPHAWTRDSRAVIFESNRNGNFDLFKQYIDQRTPQTIVATPLTEMLPQLAPDSRFLLYEARQNQIAPGSDKLMRVPVEGGTPEEVPIGGPLDEFRCALDRGKRCVLRTTVRGEYYAYYDLDPLRGKGRELTRTKWIPGILGDWDVSPDGKHVAIPNHDSRDARIRVVALEAGPNDLRERELVLPGLTNIRGLVWAADGQGWFVSVDTTVGNRLLYVYQDGQFRSLGDIQGWAVPSPDGRRVAFLDRIVATNAWMIDLR